MAGPTKVVKAPTKGRRPKSPEQVKRNQLSIWLSDEQMDLARGAAEADYDRVHNWCRRMILQAAKERMKAIAASADGAAAKLE
jgi:hypothetical protein